MSEKTNDPFAGNAAWCTKESWDEWHFYINSALTPLCGKILGLFENDQDLMVVKCHPDGGTCPVCVSQGVRVGFWKV